MKKEFNLDFKSNFYKNCKRRRKEGAKICDSCPFCEWIEQKEKRVCEQCGSHDIIMFTSDLDICTKCNHQQQGI